jgi:hypothetical protein
MQQKKKGIGAWLMSSDTLQGKTESRKIAYVAVMTALIAAANMFFEFKFADVQFSFTLAISAIVGLVLGPLLGFAAAFLGDLAGFLYNSGGFAYMPWIGLSMGMVAFIAGFIGNSPWKGRGVAYIKLAMISVATLLLCTIAINTTAFWILYGKVDYWAYLISRLFIQGQIYNSLVNYALLFIAVPALNKVKALKIHIG